MTNKLTHTDSERYKRQLMLHGFTEEHQQRLKNATVFVAGVGGLGGTAALYLAAAGIGRMVLAHAGNLTLSNMNRQVLMKTSHIGKSRVVQAKESLQGINPDVDVEIYDERITAYNVRKLLRTTQLALSARPNFQERRALNQACIEQSIPMVEAAMNGMEGYIFNVIPKASPCLHCMYPTDDPSWEELGFPVLGAVSGMLGCMMALEAIKLLTGFGKPLLSRMLIFNTLDFDFRVVRIPKNDHCPVCGAPEQRGQAFSPAAHAGDGDRERRFP
jgi:molybdopterin/thiamine biosynthesis adenylyltransferase